MDALEHQEEGSNLKLNSASENLTLNRLHEICFKQNRKSNLGYLEAAEKHIFIK